MSLQERSKNQTEESPRPLTIDELDTVNLDQALIDFEIANARVVDLTGRVTSMSAELLKLRSEIGSSKLAASIAAGQAEASRNEAVSVRRELAEIRGSLAFRVLRKLGDARASLRHGR